MTTDFSDIYDQFMMSITDHRLTTLFNASQPDFETYLSGFLIPAIGDFTTCNQSLSYTDGVFDETLNQRNINILALLMKKRWLDKEVDNILQMDNVVQDKDYKTFAQSQNMMAKQARLNQMREEVSQALWEYNFDNTDMTNWFNQNFIP